MRILSVSQSYFPYLREGGRPTKVRALATCLRNRGHEITVLTADLGPFTISDDESSFYSIPSVLGKKARHDGIDIIYLRSSLRRRTVTINPPLLRFCREELRGFDVVHVYGIYDFMGPIVAKYCRRLGIPYVIETMGMYRPITRGLFAKRIYHATIGRQFIQGAARLIVTAEREAQELREGGVPRNRITLRPNGVTVSNELPRPGAFREAHGIKGNARVVLFLGRMIPRKSPDMLLRAFARVVDETKRGRDRGWHLVLAGPQEDEGYVDGLKRMAQRLDVSTQVTFSEGFYGSEKWSAYRDATVFVLPSSSENFGNTVAESIACGTPVIVTDCCGVANSIGSGENAAGLVIPHDETALEEALRRIGSDEALLQRLALACKHIAPALGWDGPVDQLESLYSEIRASSDAVPASALC